jgi:RNA polymerase sigma-70 factor (ECF subfamily)
MADPDPHISAAPWPADIDVNVAFDAIYRTEAPWLVRFFRRQLGNPDDAQDLAQETMLRFIRTEPVSNIATPQAYLRRIATNLLRDRFGSGAMRLARASTPLIEGLDFETEFDQHRVLAGREELAVWEQILARLKPQTLEIFLLSRIDGYTYQQIADRLGMTVWNVKKHMMKAIAHVERHRRQR